MSRRQKWAAITLILLLGAALRLWGLGAVPPGLAHDEVANWLIAQDILAGHHAIYFTAAYGHEPLYQYVQAASVALFGDHWLGLRWPSVAFGLLGIAATYTLTRRLFGGPVALLTVAWLATSFWPLFYARVALRAITLPFTATLAAYILLRATNSPTSQSTAPGVTNWLLAGLFLGISLYTYMAARILPFIIAAFLIYLFLIHSSTPIPWSHLLVFFLVAAVVSAPLVIWLMTHPGAEYRIAEVREPLDRLLAGDPSLVWQNLIANLKFFTFAGDPWPRQNLPGRPVFADPISAALFYAGLAIALWRWHDPRYGFPLIWLVGALVPSIVTSDAPSSIRDILGLVVVFIFPALALVEAGRWLKRRRQEAGGRRQEARGRRQEARCKMQDARGKTQDARGKTQEARGKMQEARGKMQDARGKMQEARGKMQDARGKMQDARGSTQVRRFLLPASCFPLPASCFPLPASCFLLLASCFLLLASCFLLLAPCLFLTVRDYFFAWPRHDVVRFDYQADLTAVAHRLDELPPGTPVTVAGLSVHTMDGPSLRLAAQRDVHEVRLCDTRETLVVPAGRDAWLFVPQVVPFDGDLEERLSKWGAVAEGDSESSFASYRLSNDAVVERDLQRLETTAALPDGSLAVLPVSFGGRLAFLGYEWTRQTFAPGDSPALLTYWRVETPPPIPLKVFVHLLGESDTPIAQDDGLGSPPHGWAAGDLIVQKHVLPLPVDLPLGLYRLHLGVYNAPVGPRLSVAGTDRLILPPIEVNVP